LFSANKNTKDSFYIDTSGYYFKNGSSIELAPYIQVEVFTEKSTEITDSQILEKIATENHIINQSVSLIALENDTQRADLERYSGQEDKYDTTYQNFTNDPSPQWNSR